MCNITHVITCVRQTLSIIIESLKQTQSNIIIMILFWLQKKRDLILANYIANSTL